MSHDGARDAWIELLWAERACARLVHRYFGLIDDGRAGAVVDLLGPDPVVEAAGGRWEGREVVARVMRVREAQADRRTRHAITDLAVDVDAAGDEATATATLVVFDLDGGMPTVPHALSDLEMRFARVEGDWTIVLHRSRRLAEAPA